MADEEQSPELQEFERLVSWRYLMLLGLGFSLSQASEAVRNPRLDWHVAEYVLANGFSHDQAMLLLVQPNLDWETLKRLIEMRTPTAIVLDNLT